MSELVKLLLRNFKLPSMHNVHDSSCDKAKPYNFNLAGNFLLAPEWFVEQNFRVREQIPARE